MSDFFLNLKSPGWWLGVVVVSFLINLASAYAKPILDRAWARISESRRKKLKIANDDLERQAELIERQPDGVVLVALEELTFLLGALLCGIFTVLLLIFASLPLPIFGSKPPTEFLLFIPILILITGVCMHAASKKAALLKVLKAKRHANRA